MNHFGRLARYISHRLYTVNKPDIHRYNVDLVQVINEGLSLKSKLIILSATCMERYTVEQEAAFCQETSLITTPLLRLILTDSNCVHCLFFVYQENEIKTLVTNCKTIQGFNRFRYANNFHFA